MRVKHPSRAESAPGVALQPALARATLSEAGLTLYRARLAKCRKGGPAGQSVESWRGVCLRENVGALVERRLWVTRDAKTGRTFHNVSSLPGFLRPHLLIDGAATVEIDIKNSQPFFLAQLYPATSAERTGFITLVGAGGGGFYEAINGGPFATDAARQKTKRAVFREILFGRMENVREMWAAFAAEFPELAGIISQLKWDETHRALALKLQSLEADAIIAGVLPEMLAAGVPVLTVHDSVLCKADDKARVWEAIGRHCARVVGAMPALKAAATPKSAVVV